MSHFSYHDGYEIASGKNTWSSIFFTAQQIHIKKTGAFFPSHHKLFPALIYNGSDHEGEMFQVLTYVLLISWLEKWQEQFIRNHLVIGITPSLVAR